MRLELPMVASLTITCFGARIDTPTDTRRAVCNFCLSAPQLVYRSTTRLAMRSAGKGRSKGATKRQQPIETFDIPAVRIDPVVGATIVVDPDVTPRAAVGCVVSWIANILVNHLHYLFGGLVFLQTMLIVMLLIQNRRHLRAKADARKHYAEVTHAARLALVGEITASIAHEVTQPLSAILSNVETAEFLLREPKPQLAPVLAILTDVRQDDLRAYDIVRRLRTLLRKRELQFERVDINALTSNVLALVLPDAVRRNVVIRAVQDPNLPCVTADPVHLQQVLLNLIINAMEAMREIPAAQRRLDVRTQLLDDAYVQVAVLDNGYGIAPAHRVKLFDSFFTTKDDGMGLGLAIARSIVTMHGGAIWGENRAGGGAAFFFTVPVRTPLVDAG